MAGRHDQDGAGRGQGHLRRVQDPQLRHHLPRGLHGGPAHRRHRRQPVCDPRAARPSTALPASTLTSAADDGALAMFRIYVPCIYCLNKIDQISIEVRPRCSAAGAPGLAKPNGAGRWAGEAEWRGAPGWRSRMARGAGLAEKPMGSGPCRGPPQSLTLTVSLFARPVTTMCSGAGPLATRAAHLPHLGTPRVEL